MHFRGLDIPLLFHGIILGQRSSFQVQFGNHSFMNVKPSVYKISFKWKKSTFIGQILWKLPATHKDMHWSNLHYKIYTNFKNSFNWKFTNSNTYNHKFYIAIPFWKNLKIPFKMEFLLYTDQLIDIQNLPTYYTGSYH